MRLMSICALLQTGLALAAPGVKDPPKASPSVLVGQWVIESSTLSGNPLPVSDRTVTFTAGGTFETRAGGIVAEAGTYTTDPKKEPAELDMTPAPDGAPGGRSWPGIYKVEGDTLTVCVMTDQRKRPTTFDPAAGSGMIKTVYKRVKPKD